MADDSTLQIHLDADLRDAFLAEATASQQSAEDLLRNYVAAFVEERRRERTYDTWFRAEVQKALVEADHPDAVWISHDDVEAEWAERMEHRLAHRNGDA